MKHHLMPQASGVMEQVNARGKDQNYCNVALQSSLGGVVNKDAMVTEVWSIMDAMVTERCSQ